MLICLRVQLSLVLFAIYLFIGALFEIVKLLVSLKLVESLPLLLYHVTVGEGEVVVSFDRLEALFVILSLVLLLAQHLVGCDEGVHLMSLVFLLILSLL